MKLYIIGSVGSGKSTMARRLSHALSIPHFETDNFVWQRQEGGDVRNAEPVRDAQFLAAVTQEDWIIEGVHIGWTENAIRSADMVIFLDIPYHQRTYQCILRYLKQRVGVERSNYKPRLSMLLKMFKWNRYFEETMKPVFLEKLESIPEKTRVLKKRRQVSEFLVEQIRE
ncbi:DNA topology modulation protein FlaR [Planococcus sp. SE5232]|uniref:DNA topology modulation protein FlaR n=1 Tax=unclassified Planococcus (in: firmicutes) TaxID=2662419 RepID=UPI001CBDED6D|nr:DNA topology modulation protein FlaR [Planococcus sp. 4-30]